MTKGVISNVLSMSLGNGYTVVLSEETGLLKCMPQGGNFPFFMGTAPEEFLKKVGFTINNRMDRDIAYDVVVNLFKFITCIDYEYFKSIVKTLDMALQEKGKIGLYF